MKASVVVNVHRGTQFEQFSEAADSILCQDHGDVEFVVVASDAPDILEKIKNRYGDVSETRFVTLAEDNGLSAARNAGAEAATGEIVVFTDDDIVAEPEWISELIAIYETHDPAGVGGHVVPIWPDDEPWYLPTEFYWLVGVMHNNFVAELKPQPVRNTFGCNISFDCDAFFDAGEFREDLGKNQTNPLQGEEAELCERIDGEFWYTPDANVRHKVNSDQLSISYLLRRAFWQGYSKAALSKNMSNESSFLVDLISKGLPRRLKNPTWKGAGQIVILLALTGAVGLGFLYGRLNGSN